MLVIQETTKRFSTKKQNQKALLFVLLTYSERIFLELCGQVGDVGHTVQVSLQDVPTHLVIEWVAEFGWDLKEERAMGVIRRIHTETDKRNKRERDL